MPLILAVALIACGRKEKATGAEADKGIHNVVERGPVSVKLDLDRKELTIADRLNLTLEVTAAEDCDVQLPRFGDKLEQFGIVDYHTDQPVLVESNRTRTSRSYVLEPFLSGEYTIPPMTVEFSRKGDTNRHEIETEQIAVTVKSLLPGKKADLSIHDIVPPVELPRRRAGWLWGAAVAVCLVCLTAVLLVRKRRRSRKAQAEAEAKAHELAYRELEKLISEDLIGKGNIKEFHQRLSDILRRYIENRFALCAPEQTTEEFLDNLKYSGDLNRQYRSLLETFLRHCDLVKFAEHQPRTEDIQSTFDSCKAFIAGTMEAGPDVIPGEIRTI